MTDLGDGRFKLEGRLDLSNVGDALSRGQNQFNRHNDITVDLDEADCASTAGLALLLEWATWSITHRKRLEYRNAHGGLTELLDLHDVAHLLRMSAN